MAASGRVRAWLHRGWPLLSTAGPGRRLASAASAASSTATATPTLSRRFFHVALSGVRGTCTASGAVGLAAFGFVVCPYVSRRAPLDEASCEALEEDLVQISALDGGDLLTMHDIWSSISELRVPAFSFHDLQRPFCFRIFQLVGRFTFACYSDASGVMTLHEFQCAVHKMVDLALELHSQNVESTEKVRAAAVRELTSIVVPALFRVLDFDQSGDIGTHEFIRGALLLLATVQGAPLDTPQLADLAFRVVDTDGDGLVTVAELKKWVVLGLEHEVVPRELQLEPYGPFGLFGVRVLTPEKLASKWLREADVDRDGKLLPDEFQILAPRLRIHRVIASMAGRFAAHLPEKAQREAS